MKKRLPSTRGLTSSSVYQLLWALSSWVRPWSLEEASTYSTWSTTASLASLSLSLASLSASYSTGYMVSKMVKKVVIEVNHALKCPVQSMSSQTALIRDFVTFFLPHSSYTPSGTLLYYVLLIMIRWTVRFTIRNLNELLRALRCPDKRGLTVWG